MQNDQETSEMIRKQMNTSRRLYQLASLLIAHLCRYENTERFDKTLLSIITENSETPFEDNVEVCSDPTSLV